MALTKEEKSARSKEKRAAWKNEVMALYTMREQKKREQSNRSDETKSYQEARLLRSAVLRRIHDEIKGEKFKVWYECTTGDPVSEFINKVVISNEEYFKRYVENRSISISQFEWTKIQIEMVDVRNPWRNPERKALWGEKLQDIECSRERRRIMIRLATPPWANKQKMIAIYEERELLVRETGNKYDVDHIIPIVNHLVCGLHNEFNLRVIPESENRKKSNSFSIENFC